MKVNLLFKFYLFVLILGGCTDSGLQGTNIASDFDGITYVESISPTTIQLSWTLHPRFKEYNIYRKGYTSPHKTETFGSTKVSSLSSNTVYEFGVTGVESGTSKEEGYGKYVTAQTLPNFLGIGLTGAQAQENGSVSLTWVRNGTNVTYKVFAKKQNETWNFAQPVTTVVGTGLVTVSSLSAGSTYCFWVVAEYKDLTLEPVNQSEAYVNSRAPCVLVQSLLANLPAVKVNRTFIGSFPWFWTEGGDSTYKTEIFTRNNDIRVAVVNGNDYFRSVIPVDAGAQDLYAKVTGAQGVSLVDVQVAGLGAVPTMKPNVKSVEDESVAAPIFPELAGNGKGIQELGRTSIAGDFNCDGMPDLAVSAPAATPFVSGARSQTLGSIVVYYSYLPDAVPGYPAPTPKLKTDVTPSVNHVFPNPQLIYYTNLSSGARFGRDIKVGNINGDCFSRYITTDADTKANRAGTCDDLFNVNTIFSVPILTKIDKIKRVHSCDDLVVLASNKSFYVLFGDPVKGLVTGAGGSSLGYNEFTCDQSSYKCRPARYEVTSATSLDAMAVGDYNNDGFDDVAITAEVSSKKVVKVFRGTLAGTVSDTASIGLKHNVVDLVLSGDNSYDGNTDGNDDIIVTYPHTGALVYTGNSGLTLSDSFGYALGTAFNSRFCMKDATYTGFRQLSENSASYRQLGYDFTKCDDLIIGAPGRGDGRGSVFHCRGQFSEGNGSVIPAWDCIEAFPDPSLSGTNMVVKRFGQSILGVENQNGYPMINIYTPPNHFPNVTGALYVGAPETTVFSNVKAGAVFGYYMTPDLTNANGGLGGFREVFEAADSLTGHDVRAVNTLACDPQNNNVSFAGGALCYNQVLFTSPAEAGVQFGYSIGHIKDTESIDRGLPSIAISAPYRSVVSSDGSRTITGSGVVYLFKADISAFGYEGGTRIDSSQLRTDTSDGCVANCTWYSGGVNPAGPSLIYVKDLTAGASFGLGGSTGADFNGDGAGDFVSGSPFNSSVAFNHGASFIYYSNGSFSASVSSPSLTLTPNFSKELNYQFEQTKAVGDINGDGYDDVAAHTVLPGRVAFYIYYGTPTGLRTYPKPSLIPAKELDPQLVAVTSDTSFGDEFFGIGSVNGDAYADIFITGSKASYVYYGSSSGLVTTNQPSLSPVGQAPLKFATFGADSVSFHGQKIYGHSTSGNLSISGFDPKNRAVTSGDFNGDGYGDFAIATVHKDSLTLDNPGTINYSSSNAGRVWILYGSRNGVQSNRGTGAIKMNGSDLNGVNPCDSGGNCRIQVLAAPAVSASSQFGWSLTAVPSLDAIAGDERDELVIADPVANASLGRIYLYKGGALGLSNTPGQTLQAYINAAAGVTFGVSMAFLGDVNGDGFGDIAVAGQVNGAVSNQHIHFIYGGQLGASFGFVGPATISATDLYPSGTRLGKNRIHVVVPKPQQLEAPTGFSTSYLGAAIASVKDINGDGYSDVILLAPRKDYDVDIVKSNTGAFVVYFGSAKGMMIGTPSAPSDGETINGIADTPTITSQCYAGPAPRCEPTILYLPSSEPDENTYLSPTPTGDFNGDGVPDVILGSPGRNHPSGDAFATGVFYVL